jgi:hypothetical protein
VSVGFNGEVLSFVSLLLELGFGLLVVGKSSSSESSCRRLERNRPGNWNPALLPYSSTSIPSISRIGSSMDRSAREGRLKRNSGFFSSFGSLISSMQLLRRSSGRILLSSQSRSTLRHWRLFSRAFSPSGAAAPKIRGSAASTTGIYEDPATPLWV